MDPRQLPTGRKVLECRAEPLTYTLWEGEGKTDREGDSKRQRNREDRQEKAGSGVSQAALVNPSAPPLPVPDPHSPPKLMTQEAMMMRTPPTSATMLKSLATRPRR